MWAYIVIALTVAIGGFVLGIMTNDMVREGNTYLRPIVRKLSVKQEVEKPTGTNERKVIDALREIAYGGANGSRPDSPLAQIARKALELRADVNEYSVKRPTMKQS